MKSTNLIAGLALVVGLLFATSVTAEEATKFTVEQFQAAIEQFGVSPEQAKAAAERAVVAQADENMVTTDHDAFLAKLPSNFLEGSPY